MSQVSGAGVGPLVCVAKAQGVLGIVLAHWWVKPGPNVSCRRALAVLVLVCWPTDVQAQGPGCPEYGACPLMCEVGPRVTASSMVNEERPGVPSCRALQVLELVTEH